MAQLGRWTVKMETTVREVPPFSGNTHQTVCTLIDNKNGDEIVLGNRVHTLENTPVTQDTLWQVAQNRARQIEKAEEAESRVRTATRNFNVAEENSLNF